MNSQTDTKQLQTENPTQQYYFRALICFAAAGTLAARADWANPNLLHMFMISLLLIYAYATFHFTRKLLPEQISRIGRWLTYVDAGLIGLVLSLTNFSILPSIMFLTMIQFNALINGGFRKLMEDNTAFAIGIIISLFIHSPQLVLSSNIEISAASLIGVATYFLVYAIYMHQRFHKQAMSLQQLENEQKWHKIRAYKLSRYLPPTVWQAINRGDDKHLQAERKRISVFFSDIKDFSQLAEEIEAEALTELLNHYLTEMSKIVAHYGGTIDKFMGDGIMVLFGDSASKGVKDDATRCVAMAIAMKKKIKSLQQEWFNQGIKKPLQVRMGINTGYCTVGTFGTSNHLDYTVLGTQVNLASRLESAAEPDEILISHETWSLVKDTVMCRDKGEIQVKGFAMPIKVYQVADLRKEMGKNQSYFEDRAEGFSMYLDMDKVRNYDKQRVIESLEKAAARLKDKVIV
ncbi:adenylate/guanylate cyclase domain-containing protein [Cellvibrio japonicus]|uniref:Probable adenylate cyclase n=1 Tax=Cellvibrio japonicus (strain Ueda107) TaxID=498211 RepID=B3PE47_CELJU|nr:adenylate/guanylate cyclase domain-containing protein [Cellvibrio japonicus]ACE84470.1 probable adenylate cyclase [Cellvibrio japonicus Ueda107]QEI12094.1 adenylate/guanylate cyclase domain-containing protein [Cellvibrio japonicus]QEI15668.1 adenylate/guanylate cyclase domain-containing protein [Cellvibrio japonicus]QEI19246.1 adenylate/guanylate cyclase domain-containing protein [Cellvibrio japonicus]